MGGVVGSNALLSSSPSLIWLQLGFGLAWAVIIKNKDGNGLVVHHFSERFAGIKF